MWIQMFMNHMSMDRDVELCSLHKHSIWPRMLIHVLVALHINVNGFRNKHVITFNVLTKYT